ncbi:MAG TPA: alanine racemase [Thermoanaerobaculia bacterium]|nr:alanine racemase [Thermoanaerobaculia bacterium]
MIPLPLDRLAAIVGGELRPAGAGGSPPIAPGEDFNWYFKLLKPPPLAPFALPGGAAAVVSAVAVDSRRLPWQSLFVALRGRQADGHDFLDQAAANGAAAALVRADTPPAPLPVIAVASPLAALQRLAAWYRRAHLGQVVAITGSNGKTIVKDALHAQLAGTFATAASPGSFNSQLGVPLAVLAAPPGTAVAVFEAGISAPGEMAALREVLAPDCGILTNVGLAHIAAFEGRRHLAREKLSLFAGMASREGAAGDRGETAGRGTCPPAGWLLVPDGDAMIAEEAASLGCRLIRFPGDACLPQLSARRVLDGSGGASVPGPGPAGGGNRSPGMSERLEVRFPSGAVHELRVRTRSTEIVEDVLLAVGAAHLLGVPEERIADSLRDYAPPPTRLEVWRSPSGVVLVNDLVSADPISVRAALRTTSELAGKGGRKVFVFGGMGELGPLAAAEYSAIGALAGEYRFDTLLLTDREDGSGGGGAADGADGGHSAATRDAYLAAYPEGHAEVLPGVQAVRRRLRAVLAPGDTLLLKGPRHSGIAAAAVDLMDAMAPNRLLVDLGAVAGNIAAYRRACDEQRVPPAIGGSGSEPSRLGRSPAAGAASGPRTRIMAMVKALAYGSDLVRLSSWLSDAGIDHLGVSTADEGVELRRAGIQLPILVTLPTPEEAEKLARFELLPAVYSFALVEPLAEAARAVLPPGRRLAVHLKVDTGMHRVGVAPGEVLQLARAASATGVLRVTGLMTHLASAEDPAADGDTRRQLALFDQARATLAGAGFGGLLCHAAATAAAARFPEARYDMVRLGLGLFGLYPSAAVESALPLQLAVTLLSRIAEVRTLARGDRVGYGGTYTVTAERLRVGVLPLGYHDGVPWSLSNRGAVLVDGRPAPILGRISMDSMVVGLAAAPDAVAGSEALLFGVHHGAVLRPEEVAAQAGTIPYELLARLGPRIQRVYAGF